MRNKHESNRNLHGIAVHLPLCSVNTFKAIFFASFGTLVLLMRLARNEEPAPNVLPPLGIVLLLPIAQLADDKFALFGPMICCVFSPDAMELQLFADADAAATAAADDDDDDAPRPSFTCWAPILCGGDDDDVVSKI